MVAWKDTGSRKMRRGELWRGSWRSLGQGCAEAEGDSRDEVGLYIRENATEALTDCARSPKGKEPEMSRVVMRALDSVESGRTFLIVEWYALPTICYYLQGSVLMFCRYQPYPIHAPPLFHTSLTTDLSHLHGHNLLYKHSMGLPRRRLYRAHLPSLVTV